MKNKLLVAVHKISGFVYYGRVSFVGDTGLNMDVFAFTQGEKTFLWRRECGFQNHLYDFRSISEEDLALVLVMTAETWEWS